VLAEDPAGGDGRPGDGVAVTVPVTVPL